VKKRFVLILILALAVVRRPSAGDQPLHTEASTPTPFSASADGPRTPANALPHRVAAGVMAMPSDTGLRVQGVVPDLPFAVAGIREGDVLTAIDGNALKNPRDLVAAIRAHHDGDVIRVAIVRDKKPLTINVTLRESPRITSDAFDVLYDSASADGHRYRVIVTKPRNATKAPALFVVQGLGCLSVDDRNDLYARLIDAVTRAGFVTLRVDKPGVGDSEGGPCPEVDFQSEVRAYQAGLAWLAQQPYVDPQRIALFGHSMGGIMAPLIAKAAPLKKAIVYGTSYNSWYFYMLENNRRQLRLSGAAFDEIGAEEKQFEKFNALIFLDKKSLEEALQAAPEMREHFPDGHTYAGGKPVVYFQQIYDLNLAKEWKDAKLPVTAIWGASDFVSSESDHEWLAAAVNSWLPGQGKFVRLPGIDHWFTKTADVRQSLAQHGEGEFNPAIIEAVLAELNGV
jgi:pimeloyl-ACP methyl ester carboxylesterase